MKPRKKNKLWLNNLTFFAMGVLCTITVFAASDDTKKPLTEPSVYILQEETAIVEQTPEPDFEETPVREPIVEDLIEQRERPIIPHEEPATNISCTENDICLIATVTMAEAEGEPEEGQRWVIDTILNRVDDPHFPDTIEEVIYQPNQFTCMWNGRIDRCSVRDDIYELVLEELECRANNSVVFFNAGHYSAYGVPYEQIGHHYFSAYE